MTDSLPSKTEVCKPCPHFPGYYGGMQYSDHTCPICRVEAERDRLRGALMRRDYLLDQVRPFLGDKWRREIDAYRAADETEGHGL